MTTAFAMTVLAVAAIGGASFVWWMFSGAAAWIGSWIEPEDRDERPPPTGILNQRDHDD